MNLKQNALKFFRQKYPNCSTLEGTISSLNDPNQPLPIAYYSTITLVDFDSGIKHKVIVTDNVEAISIFSNHRTDLTNDIFSEDEKIEIISGNALGHKQYLSTKNIKYSTKVFFYSKIDTQEKINLLRDAKIQCEIVNESELYHSVFISYGDPDEEIAYDLNDHLEKNGVKTWFFPKDKRGGEKLHRMMHNNINNFDKILFLCSKNSLDRNGVLNEIEETITAQARKGGKEIMFPVCLDDYLFNGWSPEPPDLKEQLMSYVCLYFKRTSEDGALKELAKILSDLKR